MNEFLARLNEERIAKEKEYEAEKTRERLQRLVHRKLCDAPLLPLVSFRITYSDSCDDGREYKGHVMGMRVKKGITYYLVATICPYDEDFPGTMPGWVSEKNIIEVKEDETDEL